MAKLVTKKLTRNTGEPRVCKGCNLAKNVEDFYRGTKNPHWLIGKCKECWKHIKRRHNWKTRDKIDPDEAEAIRERIKSCEICGSEKTLCVDHNHETGKIRGVLCFRCNSALGQLRDSIELCLKAAEYLDKETT